MKHSTRCPTALMYGKTGLCPLEMTARNFKRQGVLELEVFIIKSAPSTLSPPIVDKKRICEIMAAHEPFLLYIQGLQGLL